LLMINKETTLQKVGAMHQRLGCLFAQAAQALMQQENVSADEVIAIGSHGQTLWHDPRGKEPFSLQLGNANVIATETGVDVVSDFRGKDVALGGEGAPFAPAFHHFLFHDLETKVGVINIGGMSNLSILDDEMIGYDTGPGNVLMDLWVSKQKNFGYDENGVWAKAGKVDQRLLKTLLADSYFEKEPPKSTGRVLFNLEWLGKILRSNRAVSTENVQATLLEFTVQSIAQEVRKYALEQLMVCGGGVNNGFLMQRLQEALEGVPVCSTDAYGIDAEQMEAMLFAWLAYKRVHREKIALKMITGAKKDGVLGSLYAKD